MDVKEIRELAAVLRENNLSRLEVKDNGVSITLEAVSAIIKAVPQSTDETKTAETVYYKSGTEIKSTLVGTVYLKPDSESPAYVTVGGKVEKGDTLCLIEAMKMFNDIESDKSGIIKEICVESGQSVEFGQTLFIIEET